MRDIVQVLTRWGNWAADGNTGVDWPGIAAGFKTLIAAEGSSRITCCDDDGLIIDSCVCALQRERANRAEEIGCILLHYVYGLSKRAIGRRLKISEKSVRIHMLVAEGYIEGRLSALGVRLSMDPEVEMKKS